jgi:glycerophosphoryl diester phosphodiesterase
MRAERYEYFDAPFLALAHRGGHADRLEGNIENTIANFRHAADLGYRYLETDVQATRDGHLVVFHDPDLARLTGREGTIGDLTLAEVRALRVGGEPIPTMDEVYEEFPDHRFNVDLKSDAAAEPMALAILRHKAERRTLVATFSARRRRAFRALVGDAVPVSAARADTAWTAWAPLLPRFVNGPAAALQVPLRFPVGRFTPTVYNTGLLQRAHARGMQVHVWTIDDPAEMNALIDQGVDGLVTNAVETLRDVLAARGLWGWATSAGL